MSSDAALRTEPYLVEVDLTGVIEIYRELYALVFAERLRRWGVRAGAVVERDGDTIRYGAPAALMTPTPAERVRAWLTSDTMEAGEALADLDRQWRDAAARLASVVEGFWAGLVAGEADAVALRELIGAKAVLTAQAMDGVVPGPADVRQWHADAVPGADPEFLDDLTSAAWLPTSGTMAYDDLELAEWDLAVAAREAGDVPEQARARFVHDAVFFDHASLDTDRRDDVLHGVPRRTARFRLTVATDAEDLLERRRAVIERGPRRRAHRQWARETVRAAVADVDVRDRLLRTHRFLGSARDFDETKRRLNVPVWRSLFALADGLGISLRAASTTIDVLADALDDAGGRVEIDPVLRAGAHPGSPRGR